MMMILLESIISNGFLVALHLKKIQFTMACRRMPKTLVSSTFLFSVKV